MLRVSGLFTGPEQPEYGRLASFLQEYQVPVFSFGYSFRVYLFCPVADHGRTFPLCSCRAPFLLGSGVLISVCRFLSAAWLGPGCCQPPDLRSLSCELGDPRLNLLLSVSEKCQVGYQDLLEGWGLPGGVSHQPLEGKIPVVKVIAYDLDVLVLGGQMQCLSLNVGRVLRVPGVLAVDRYLLHHPHLHLGC